MSEPWLKVYAADMRGDWKVLQLRLDYRYLLIQAWDLAKNGSSVPGEMRDLKGVPSDAQTFAKLCSIHGHTARHFYHEIVRLGLAELTDDGAIRFPNLLHRQGIDPTAPERMRRYRERKRYGDVTAPKNGPVTGQIPDTIITPLPPLETGDDRTFRQRLVRAESDVAGAIASGDPLDAVLADVRLSYGDDIADRVAASRRP